MAEPSTPLPEQGGFDERLDKSLEPIVNRSYLAGKNNSHPNNSNLHKVVDEAKAAIRTLVLEEIIGEDEPEYSLDNPSWGSNRTRNKLRAEQRKKLGGTNGTK